MSLRSVPWWGAFVSGLRLRSIDVFAEELGLSVEELIEGLIEADPGGPAEDAPWWPEVLRQRGTVPLRALARRFRAEPRRLRRALARAGLRVGGEELDGRGVPALAGLRHRLGREPDAILAREAGVTVQAVQGERRRLGIGPFRPGAPPEPVLTPEEEAWIRGPEPVRRGRLRPDPAGSLEVVRRPSRAERGEGTPEQRPSAPETDRPRRPEHEHLVGERQARPDRVDRRPELLDRRPELVERRPFERRPELVERRDLVLRRDPTQPARMEPVVEARDAFERDRGERVEARESELGRRLGRDFFRARGEDELARLLQPGPRARDGRQRIVRDAAPRSSPGATREAGPACAESPPPQTAPTAISEAPPLSQPTPAPISAAPPLSQPTPAPISAPPPAAEASAATTPAASTTPAATTSPAATTTPAATTSPAASTRTPAARPTLTWLVRLPDDAPPMYVTAPDLPAAARAVAERLPPALCARVGIELAGAVVGRPPHPGDLLPPLPWSAQV